MFHVGLCVIDEYDSPKTPIKHIRNSQQKDL